MSKTSDAPWNKPVEDEGRDLRLEKLPPRRRAPGEKKEDPLTELIFSTVSFKRDFRGEQVPVSSGAEMRGVDTERSRSAQVPSPPDPLSRELFGGQGDSEQGAEQGAVPEKRRATAQIAQEPQEEAPIDYKALLAARLARYEERDRELAARLSAHPKVDSAETPFSRSADPGALARAQENWFAVVPEDVPSGHSRPGAGSVPRVQGARRARRVFLAASASAAVALSIWGFVHAGTLRSSAFTLLSRVQNLFSTSSFVVLPGETDGTHPLALLWQGIVQEGGTYLFLTTRADRPASSIGEPLWYAYVKVADGRARVEQAGKVADLNAALPAKIVPPEAVQAVKTGFDIYEAGWFLDFEKTGAMLAELFQATTRREVDGVFTLSEGAAERFVAGERVDTDTARPEWIGDTLAHLQERPAGSLQQLVRLLDEASGRGELQAYVKDPSLRLFVLENNLASRASFESRDALGVGLRVWEGEGVELSLAELRPTFFEDGSVVTDARTYLVNGGEAPVRAYLKMYIPFGSFVLEQEGFRARPPVPSFDYKGSGFREHPAIVSLNESRGERFSRLDFFHEGQFLAVGGWVELAPGQARTLRITYRLPERLNWQAGEDTYDVTVLRPGWASTFPFRFTAAFGGGVSFDWVEPEGFLTAGAAEFQGSLERDEVLTGRVTFTADD